MVVDVHGTTQNQKKFLVSRVVLTLDVNSTAFSHFRRLFVRVSRRVCLLQLSQFKINRSPCRLPSHFYSSTMSTTYSGASRDDRVLHFRT